MSTLLLHCPDFQGMVLGLLREECALLQWFQWTINSQHFSSSTNCRKCAKNSNESPQRFTHSWKLLSQCMKMINLSDIYSWLGLKLFSARVSVQKTQSCKLSKIYFVKSFSNYPKSILLNIFLIIL